MKKYFNRSIAILLALTAAVGCGGGSGLYYGSSVDEVTVRDSTIEPGAKTTIRVKLYPGADFTGGYDSDGEGIYASEAFGLTVMLPKEVAYVDKSSRLSEDLIGDILFGNPDPKRPFEQGTCKDGRQFLHYFFEYNELGDPTDVSIASIYLKLDLIVPQQASGKFVGAAISWQSDACDEPSDRQVQLTVQ